MLALLLPLGCDSPAPPSIDHNPVPPAAAEQVVPDVAVGQMPPAMLSRAEIVADEHIFIAGTVTEGCDGAIRIDVIEGESETPGPPSAITVHQLPDGEYDFNIAAPAGRSLQVTAICDADRDGRISPTDDLTNLLRLDAGSEDHTDLELAWLDQDAAALAAGAPQHPPSSGVVEPATGPLDPLDEGLELQVEPAPPTP